MTEHHFTATVCAEFITEQGERVRPDVIIQVNGKLHKIPNETELCALAGHQAMEHARRNRFALITIYAIGLEHDQG